jgi:DNA-directed RNA polymerase specialized sigma24 family protein
VLEERSFRELAEVLGVPLQTAAARVRRALIQVRERLDRAAIAVER